MKLKKIITAACLFAAIGVGAQDCVLPVSVRLDEEFTNVPQAANSMLYNAISRVVTANGLSTEAPTSPFVVTVHCDVLDKSNLPGPPVQTVYNLGVTFYLADTYTQKKFATTYITVDGVGNGETKSYIDAFKHINSRNADIKKWLNEGKAKMMNYYNSQYPNILKEAERLAAMQNYEEAMAMVLSIPICSKGGDKATKYGVELYTRNLNRYNLYVLNTARAIWAAGGDADAAREACSLLAQIDPEASCYGEASALMTEIKGQVRSDIDFEMRQKYNDKVQLEASRIEAIRAVGVAYGTHQKPTTTNLMWLR